MCLTVLLIEMIGYMTNMQRSSRTWIFGIVVIGIVGALFAVDLRGFRMWEMPFVVFGLAIMVYALFSWNP